MAICAPARSSTRGAIVNEAAAGVVARQSRGSSCRQGRHARPQAFDREGEQRASVRGRALPYIYARADVAPLFYFRLATLTGMEGRGDSVAAGASSGRTTCANGIADVISGGHSPDFLSPVLRSKTVRRDPAPACPSTAGARRRTRGSRSARVRLARRVFGYPRLDIIALDRTKVVRPSSFRGVRLAADEDLPVAFVQTRPAASGWSTVSW
jgi:hypothetical protein